MMKIYENDDLVISPKYKAMSISELEEEKDRLLRVLRASDRPKKKICLLYTSCRKGAGRISLPWVQRGGFREQPAALV